MEGEDGGGGGDLEGEVGNKEGYECCDEQCQYNGRDIATMHHHNCATEQGRGESEGGREGKNGRGERGGGRGGRKEEE